LADWTTAQQEKERNTIGRLGLTLTKHFFLLNKIKLDRLCPARIFSQV
jgi:hypothetical protein